MVTTLKLTEQNSKYLVSFLADYAIEHMVELPQEAREKLTEILNIVVPGQSMENVDWELVGKSVEN
jgi:hypothetical protein